jgi:hypothetical protein
MVADDGTACAGDDPCASASECIDGACTTVVEKSCDDIDPCTEDACDPTLGCQWTPIVGCGGPPAGECSLHSARFDGSSCIQVPGILTAGVEAITVEFWIRVTSYDTNAFSSLIVDKYEGPALDFPGVKVGIINTGIMGIWEESMHYQETYPAYGANGEFNGKGHGILTLAKFKPGDWHHYAAQRDEDGKVRIFYDGQSQNSTNWDDFYPDFGNPDDLWIGCADGTQNYLSGVLDELRISTIARYNAGGFDLADTIYTPDADTVALYRFDEGAGDMIVDSSGNTFHGTWIGDGAWDEPAPVIGCE